MGKRPEVPVATAIWVKGTLLVLLLTLNLFSHERNKIPTQRHVLSSIPRYLIGSQKNKHLAMHAWKFWTPRPIAGTIQNQCRPPHGPLAPCLRWRVRADSAKAPDRLTKAGPGESGCGLPSGHEPIESRPVDGLPFTYWSSGFPFTRFITRRDNECSTGN